MTDSTPYRSLPPAPPVRRWVFLAGAIVCEVSATLALRASLDAPGWYAVTAGGYVAAFGLLSLTLEAGTPVGVAYGIWAATGVALTAALAAPLFGEALSPVIAAGIGLIVLGVILVEAGSHHALARDGS